MAQVPSNPQADAQAGPQETQADVVALALGNIGALRARLLTLRGKSPKEYDKVLKQSFPLDVLTLLEMIAIDYGNRTAALAYRFDELADLVVGDEDEDEDEPIETQEEMDAMRVLADYVRGLPDLPEDVKAAVGVLEKGGLWAEPEDGNEDEPDEADEAAANESPKEESNAATESGAPAGVAPGGTSE